MTPEGKLRFHFHPGQWRAWQSLKRFISVLAGTQGGKTVFGPPWLYREIQRRGPGDYLVIAPTYPLLIKKALPEFLKLFKRRLKLGDYVGSPRHCFTFSADGSKRTFGHETEEPTCVYFGHASDPDSLEAATAKAAWLDEAGQKKFRLGSFEAILRRLSIHQGRVLITTTPYDLGWLKQKLYDPWKAAGENHPLIDVIRFDSTENPAFPREEFERARESLPRWKFNMYYRAIFERPAGLIYDSFDEKLHKITHTMTIPRDWRRHIGLDFGGVNTVGIFFAEEPDTQNLYCYREYKAGGRTAKEHAKALLDGEPGIPNCVGGSKSEDQWRNEFAAASLPVRAPEITEVELGIERVYGCHKRGEIKVFDDLAGYLEEKMTYSRPVNERGEPMEGIENKSDYHFMDAERYIIGWLRKPECRFEITLPDEDSDGVSEISRAPEGVFIS